MSEKCCRVRNGTFKEGSFKFIPIHIRVPYIQYTSVFHNACAGRQCGERIYFFFFLPFSFFSFLGLSSCLPCCPGSVSVKRDLRHSQKRPAINGLPVGYTWQTRPKRTRTPPALPNTLPTPSDHSPTPSAVSSLCSRAHQEARPYCHTYKAHVPRPY
jgi:hypothetical protein